MRGSQPQAPTLSGDKNVGGRYRKKKKSSHSFTIYLGKQRHSYTHCR